MLSGELDIYYNLPLNFNRSNLYADCEAVVIYEIVLKFNLVRHYRSKRSNNFDDASFFFYDQLVKSYFYQ